MRLLIAGVSIAALAIAGVLTAGTASAADQGKMKPGHHHHHHHHHHAKPAAHKGGGWKSCGVGKYHKGAKCMDASAKKTT
jgi:hypothetical protein